MITFKENTFVKGTYDELMEMAKAIEEKGAKVYRRYESPESNHLWYCKGLNDWTFFQELKDSCEHELTKAQLYEAYGIVETRPIQISQETATRWYNGEDNELKQLAIQTFPELYEATPKVGDLCLFSNDEEQFNSGFGVVGVYRGKNKNNLHECEGWGSIFFHCKKIKSIEFY